MEIGNLPEKEFRIMIVKMIQHLGKRMEAKIEKMQEMFNKDLEELKNKQTKMNNTITEVKNTLEGINNRITEAEKRITNLEDRMVEFTVAEQTKEKRMKRNEDSLRDLWDNIKCKNILIIGVPEGEEREKGPEKIFEEIIVSVPRDLGTSLLLSGLGFSMRDGQVGPLLCFPTRATSLIKYRPFPGTSSFRRSLLRWDMLWKP